MVLAKNPLLGQFDDSGIYPDENIDRREKKDLHAGKYYNALEVVDVLVDIKTLLMAQGRKKCGKNWASHQVSIGTVPTQILPFNSSRKSVILQNNSTNKIFLGGRDVSAVAGDLKEGFILGAAGADDDGTGGNLTFDNCTGEIYGVSSAASDLIVLQEVE